MQFQGKGVLKGTTSKKKTQKYSSFEIAREKVSFNVQRTKIL